MSLGRRSVVGVVWLKTYSEVQRLSRICQSFHSVYREWNEMDLQLLWGHQSHR
jgi:hypothetical protein